MKNIEKSTAIYVAVFGVITLVLLVIICYLLFRCHQRDKSEKSKAADDENSMVSAKSGTGMRSGDFIPLTSIVSGKVSLPSLEEFESLICYQNDLGQKYTNAQGQRYNKIGGLNLVPINLPFDHNRIKLKRPINGCDYINANWITPQFNDNATYDELIYTSYLPCNKIQFAVGQEPMPIQYL